MGLKEILKKITSEEKNITVERYKAAKFVFIVTSFLFFINLYFVWASFYDEFLTDTLSIMYILLLLSVLFFIYFFLKKNLFWKMPEYFFYIVFALLFIIFIFLLLLVIFPGWFNWIIEFIRLYY